MPRVPVARHTKQELVEMGNWRCEHNHTGLEHYTCWLRYGKQDKKVGYLDIEASNLNADFGIMLSYFIKEDGVYKYHGRALKGKEVIKDQDLCLLKECVEDMQKFDVLVTYYGTGFDIPFIRARCLMNNIDFPFYGEILHKDAYYIAKSKLKISSKRLANVARVVLGHNDKTRVDGRYWLKALQGCDESLGYIEQHNRIDCDVLEEVYKRLLPYNKTTKRSI